MTLVIRACQSDDLPAVFDLMGQLGEVTEPPAGLTLQTVESVFGDMQRLPEVYLNLVGDGDGRVVAFISVIFYKTLYHRGGTALINELVVDRALRRAGIGQALIRRAREEALERGMNELEVGTESANRAAQQFYHKCGFDEEYVLLGMDFD